jgi:hypothetical protein
VIRRDLKVKRIVLSIILSLLLMSASSGIGVKGNIPIGASRPGILGIIDNGASVYPVGGLSNAKAYPDRIKTSVNISRLEFICNTISSCGMYPYGKGNNGDGAIVNLGGVRSGAIVSL